MKRYEALRPYDGEPYFLHSEWQDLHFNCKQKVLENPGTWIRRRWGISLPIFSILAAVRMSFLHAPQLCANLCMLWFVPVTDGLERLAWVSVLYHTLVYGVGLIALFTWSLWHLLAESKDSAFFAMLFVLPPHHFFGTLGWIVRADHNEEILATAWSAANLHEHESRAETIRSLLYVLLCTDRIFVASVYIFLLNPYGLEEYANFVDPVLLTICWITAGAMQASEGLHFWTVAALVTQSLGTVSFCAFIGHTRGLTIPGGDAWDQVHARRLFLQHVKFLAFAFAADAVIFGFGFGGARFTAIAIFLVPPVLLVGATSFVLLFDMFMDRQNEDYRCNGCCLVAVVELVLVLLVRHMRLSAGGPVTNGVLVVALLVMPMVLTGWLMQRVGFAGGSISGDSLSDLETGARDDSKDSFSQPAHSVGAHSVSSSQASQALRVTIVAAGCTSGHPTLGTFDELHMHCVCEIQEKPMVQFRTESVHGTCNLVWNHEQVMGGFVKGDTLNFSVYSTNTKERDLIGSAVLTSERIFPGGFQGELLLTGTAMQTCPVDCLKLRVSPAELMRQEESSESPPFPSKPSKSDSVEVTEATPFPPSPSIIKPAPPFPADFQQRQGSKATCFWCLKWGVKR